MKSIIDRLLEASSSNLVNSWRWDSGKGIIRDGGVSEGVREGARTHRGSLAGSCCAISVQDDGLPQLERTLP